MVALEYHWDMMNWRLQVAGLTLSESVVSAGELDPAAVFEDH